MDGSFKLYNYNPSFPAAVVFIVFFVLSTAIHIWQVLTRKARYFIPFTIGGIFEACGYAARAINAQETPNWSVGPYSVQSLLLLLAPSLFAASIYMILGRIISVTGGNTLSPLNPRWLSKVFVTGDVLSFLIQSGGGAILAQAKSQGSVDLGEKMITLGLFVQILFFGVFMLVAIIFHKRIITHPTQKSLSIPAPWRRYMVILYVASALILLRSLYRVIEYIQGSKGLLQRHEVCLYVFDSALMFLLSLVFNVSHPAQIVSEKPEEIETEMLNQYSRVA